MNPRNFFMVISLLLGMSVVSLAQPATISVLVVTGGHDYNRRSFEGMLDSLPGTISYKIVEFPAAFTLFEKQHRNEYDVIVFYHMWQEITATQGNELEECIREGKPLVVLHHSICAFDNWPEYINIIGGKYFHRPDTVNGRVLPVSSYKHDVNVVLQIKDESHPVTAGIADFTLLDETYDNFYVQPQVTPILVTDTPGSSKVIGWTKQYGRARVVTFQSGHDVPAYRSREYRKLLWQAINWVK
jgi:type 1 glutamine amidotransferase